MVYVKMVMWLLASPGPRGSVIFAPFWGQVTKPLFVSCMIVSSTVRDYFARQFSDGFWFFLDKFIIGSQGISLSFVFLFYLVYYFACCNFLVKFVFVFVYVVHFQSHVIKIFQLYFPVQFYVNLIYLSVKQQPFFSVRIHRV